MWEDRFLRSFLESIEISKLSEKDVRIFKTYAYQARMKSALTTEKLVVLHLAANRDKVKTHEVLKKK